MNSARRRDRVRGSKKKIGGGTARSTATPPKRGSADRGYRFCSCWGCQGRALAPPTKQTTCRAAAPYLAPGIEAVRRRPAIPLAGSHGARFTTARSFHRKEAHKSILGKFINDLRTIVDQGSQY